MSLAGVDGFVFGREQLGKAQLMVKLTNRTDNSLWTRAVTINTNLSYSLQRAEFSDQTEKAYSVVAFCS